VLLLLAGCGQQSPRETLRTELQTIKSNAATAELVARDLARGAVPQPYAKNAIQSAKDGLEGSAQSVSEIPEASNLMPHIQALQKAIDGMSDSVEKNDRAALPSLADQLAQEQQAIDDIAKQLGIEP
jgi:hypothetical protein